jgi:hypothetical protein
MAKDNKFYLFGTEQGTKGPEFNVFEKVGLGLASGALKIPEAILELGAGFVDYAADTDLVTALEENYPRINVTDGIGKFVEIGLQYGLPYGAALKIGSKLGAMKGMRAASQKGSVGSKAAAKMGYYGAPAVFADTITGSARDVTLGEAFGLYTGYEEEKEGKTGRELAGSVLKQKALGGIEGGALAGLISTAAAPAAKGVLVGGAKGAKYVGAAVSPIINPVAKALGAEQVGNVARKTLDGVKFLKEKVDPLSLRKLKVMKDDELTMFQTIKKGMGRLFTPEGSMTREGFERFTIAENTIKAVRGDLNLYLPRAKKEIDKVAKLLASKYGDSTLTRQQALFKDINEALDPAAKGDSIKIFKSKFKKSLNEKDLNDLTDAIKNLKDYGDEFNKGVVKTFTPVLNPKLKTKAKAEINEAIQSLLDRKIGAYYKAFDKNVPFRFTGKDFKENKKIAIEEAFQVLKKERGKGVSDSMLRDTAESQIEMLIRQAEKHGSEGSFFYSLRDLKKKRPKEYFTSIQEEMLKRRDFGEGKYALSLKNLLGYELNPLKSFENKYMAIASQTGQKRFVNSIVSLNKQYGNAVVGRQEKFLFQPTKNREQLLKEGVNEADIGGIIRADIRKQMSDEYGIPENLLDIVKVNPAAGEKGFSRAKAEDVFGIFDDINPLKGKDFYTSSGINKSFNGMSNYTDFLINSPLYKSFLMGKAGTQIGKTILSPVTQIRNFTSAAFFALHNGHFGNPFGFGKGNFSVTDVLKTHLDELFPDGRVTNEGLQNLAKDAARKNELGVTTGSIVQNEIDALLKDIVKEGGSYATTDDLFKKIYSSKSFKSAAAPTGKIFQKLQEFYTKGDDFWKDYGYRFTKSQLDQAIPQVGGKYSGGKYSEKQIAELIEKSHLQLFKRRPNIRNTDGTLKGRTELLEEFAAEYIKNTYPNYSFTPKFVQELRRLPLGNFISFPAEILRTSGNLVKLTGRELAMDTGDAAVDSFFRQMGSRKLMGQLAGYSTGPILASYSMKMLGMTEEQYDALRESQVAEWNKYSDLIMLGKEKTKDGNVKYRYVNYAYQNPYDYIRSPFYSFFGSMASGKKMGLDVEDRFLKGSIESFGTLFAPFLDEAILTERLVDAYRGTKKGGGRVWEDSDDLGYKLSSSFAHIVKGVAPGALSQGANVASAIAQDVTPYGKQYKLGDELMALLSGIRVYEADLKNNLNYGVNAHLREVATNKSRAGRKIFASNVTPNTVKEAYEEYVEQSFKSYNKIKKNLNDAETLGLETRTINKLFKDRKVRKDIRKTLTRGRFVPPKWKTFYNDQRFKNIARERGLTRIQLFPVAETMKIEREYRNMELLQSLDNVRGAIKVNRKETQERIAAQGLGTTADGPPLNTPPAQGAGTSQALSGLTDPITTRQRIIRDDDFLKEFA